MNFVIKMLLFRTSESLLNSYSGCGIYCSFNHEDLMQRTKRGQQHSIQVNVSRAEILGQFQEANWNRAGFLTVTFAGSFPLCSIEVMMHQSSENTMFSNFWMMATRFFSDHLLSEPVLIRIVSLLWENQAHMQWLWDVLFLCGKEDNPVLGKLVCFGIWEYSGFSPNPSAETKQKNRLSSCHWASLSGTVCFEWAQ